MEHPLVGPAPTWPLAPMLSGVRLEAGRPSPGAGLFWGLNAYLAGGAGRRAPLRALAESLTSRRMFREAFQALSLPGTGHRRLCMETPTPAQAALPGHPGGPWPAAAGCPLVSVPYQPGPSIPISMALITVPTNGLMAPLSDRLPAVISPADAGSWLDPQHPSKRPRPCSRRHPGNCWALFRYQDVLTIRANQDAACAHPVGPMLRHDA